MPRQVSRKDAQRDASPWASRHRVMEWDFLPKNSPHYPRLIAPNVSRGREPLSMLRAPTW